MLQDSINKNIYLINTNGKFLFVSTLYPKPDRRNMTPLLIQALTQHHYILKVIIWIYLTANIEENYYIIDKSQRKYGSKQEQIQNISLSLSCLLNPVFKLRPFES